MTNGNRGSAAAISAAIFVMMAGAIAAPAQTFTRLVNFVGPNGAHPDAALVQATDGNLYGVTGSGGANNLCISCGTIFEVTSEGALTTLYSFDYPTGFGPAGALVQATGGDLYGTTLDGGNNVCSNGCGTVFKVSAGGALTRLHSFDGTDGSNPQAGLVQGADGNFYGTTRYGGANDSGTIFKITLTGRLTTLYSFCAQTNCADGANIWGGLVQGNDGNFYGTAAAGGLSGDGTVFKITQDGTLTTLHSFDGTDGSGPTAGLVQGADGNFYGTTGSGGADSSCGFEQSGCGAVFKITPEGTLTTLHSFDGADGSDPIAALVQGTDGNFYGTTFYGGGTCRSDTCGNGTIFQITPDGAFATVYEFGSGPGQYPSAPLVQATNGVFYGTTDFGGTFAFGTLFRLAVGLGPFVKTLPISGQVGAAVGILGTDLTGATSVTFNGIPAAFTVKSTSLIGAAVPGGATTGAVEVTTASGKVLTSNVNFQVLP